MQIRARYQITVVWTILIMSALSEANAQSIPWLQRFGGYDGSTSAYNDRLFDILLDEEGNTYGVGQFSKTNANFGNDAPAAQEVPKTQIEFYQGKETRDNLCVDSDLQSVRLDDDLLEDGYTKDRLNYLVSEWEQNTIFLSSVQQIVEDDNFKKIVSMGRKAIPASADVSPR